MSPFLAGAEQGNVISTDLAPGSYPNTSSVVDVSSISQSTDLSSAKWSFILARWAFFAGESLVSSQMEATLHTVLHANFLENAVNAKFGE